MYFGFCLRKLIEKLAFLNFQFVDLSQALDLKKNRIISTNTILKLKSSGPLDRYAYGYK